MVPVSGLFSSMPVEIATASTSNPTRATSEMVRVPCSPSAKQASSPHHGLNVALVIGRFTGEKREEFIARVTRHLEVVVTSTLSRQMKAPAVVIGSGVLVPCLAHAYEVLGGHAIVDRRIVTSPPG